MYGVNSDDIQQLKLGDHWQLKMIHPGKSAWNTIMEVWKMGDLLGSSRQFSGLIWLMVQKSAHRFRYMLTFVHNIYIPRNPVIFSADDWGVQSSSQHNISVPLPFSEGDWIPRAYDLPYQLATRISDPSTVYLTLVQWHVRKTHAHPTVFMMLLSWLVNLPPLTDPPKK